MTLTKEDKEERIETLKQLSLPELVHLLHESDIQLRGLLELRGLVENFDADTAESATAVDESDVETSPDSSPPQTRLELEELTSEILQGIDTEILTVSAPAEALRTLISEYTFTPMVDELIVYLDGDEPCSLQQVLDLLDTGEFNANERIELKGEQLRQLAQEVETL